MSNCWKFLNKKPKEETENKERQSFEEVGVYHRPGEVELCVLIHIASVL